MTRYALVVAALLLTNLAGNAAAAEEAEHRSKNAQRLLAHLNAAGINNKTVKQLVTEVDSRIHKGYFYFGEEEFMGGKVALRYRLSGRGSKSVLPTRPGRLELRYAPDNSNFECTIRTRSVMVNYNFKF